MRAMCLTDAMQGLRQMDLPIPAPGPDQLLIRVEACGVCRTDLHLVDRELPDVRPPIVPGHEIVGRVEAIGSAVAGFVCGMRVGVPWLGHTCGRCDYCRTARENLCDDARFTGYQIDGGYAEYTLADARFCFALDEAVDAAQAAPLLCAGLIGYRSLVMCGEARRIGLYGFGAAAHIVAQVARYQGREVFAFTRGGDVEGQRFARDVGVDWCGDADAAPPRAMDAAILFAPVGALVPQALAHTVKGGVVVCGGIHMSDIPSFPYRLLWGERVLRSVANLTRADAEAFLALAPRVPVRTHVVPYHLERANEALDDLRGGRVRGAAVLIPG